MPTISHSATALLGSFSKSARLPDARGAVRGRSRTDMPHKSKERLQTELLRALQSGEIQSLQKASRVWYPGLKEYIYKKWPSSVRDTSFYLRRRKICYAIFKQSQRGAAPVPQGSGDCATADLDNGYFNVVKAASAKTTRGSNLASKRVQPFLRKRKHGGGPKFLCPEVGEELWHWFVNHIRHVKARVSNPVMVAKANAIASTIKSLVDEEVDAGRMAEGRRPKMPKINETWLSRWRRKYRVSHKCVSIAYKVSRAVLLKRLGVFWRNNIRIRYFHSKMFPNGKLNFRSYDQKPLYFNTAGESGTLAGMDEWEVEVNENVHATRQRFTVMTKSVTKEPDETMEQVKARSNNSGDPHSIAVLFKASGTGQRILANLNVPSNVKVQFGPKGSYRTEHVLEWLKHDLGEADGNGNLEVVYLDWFAAHLAEEVQDFIMSQGHVPLFIPGGATPWVATLDTHCHAPYQKEYTNLENEDSARELLRGAIMPTVNRQAVLNRAADSWKCVPHDDLSEKAWIHDGYLLPLNDSTAKHNLRRQCRYIWDELCMDDAQARILAEIDFNIETGEWSDWSQWPELLELYDNHPGLTEGEDTARERLGDPDDSSDEGDSIEPEDGDDVDDDLDDDQGGDGGECCPVEHPDIGPFPTYSEGHSSGSSSLGSAIQNEGSAASSSNAASAGSVTKPQHSPGDALKSETDIELSLRVLGMMMDLAVKENLPDPQIKKLLNGKIREMQKTKSSQTLPAEVQQQLNAAREEEKRKLAKSRDDIRAQRAERKKQDKEIELAKLAAEAAKQKSKTALRIANVKLAELQAQKQKKQDEEALAKERERLIKQHFAVKVYDKLHTYVIAGEDKNKTQLAALWPAFEKRMKSRAEKANYPLPPELASHARGLHFLVACVILINVSTKHVTKN